MNTLIDKVIDNFGFDDFAGEYGEPGYKKDHKDKPIILHDWNDFGDRYPNIYRYIQDNYNIEWSDEWVCDYDNDKIYRIVGDSYGWEK